MITRPTTIDHISILECKTQEEIESTYLIMQQLRPNVAAKDYFSRVNALMKEEKFRLFGAFDEKNQCVGVLGFQVQKRLSLGDIIYLADLVTDEAYRSRGIGSRLLNVVKQEAASQNIDAIVLDSGLQRKKAHEFYQRHGYKAESYSFRLFKPFTPNNFENKDSKLPQIRARL
jgi:GNAT superfamily N-acetyltransferase